MTNYFITDAASQTDECGLHVQCSLSFVKNTHIIGTSEHTSSYSSYLLQKFEVFFFLYLFLKKCCIIEALDRNTCKYNCAVVFIL